MVNEKAHCRLAMSYRDKLNKIGKLLTWDGGEIRGIISIEILARVESGIAQE